MTPTEPPAHLVAVLHVIEQRAIALALEEWHQIPLERRAGLSSAEALVGVFGNALAMSLACAGRGDAGDVRASETGFREFTRVACRMVRRTARHERATLNATPSDTRSAM